MLDSYLDSLEKSHEEEQVLLPAKSADGNSSVAFGRAKKLAVGAVAAIALFALAGRKNLQIHTPNPLLSLEIVTRSASRFSIKTSNEYGDPVVRRAVSGAQDYPFLSGAFLLEPYKTNTIEISAATTSAGEVAWTLSQDDSVLYSGVAVASASNSTDLTFVVSPEKCGKYTLTLSRDGQEQQKETVYVKYVRRELDQLTDEDREIFLDAMVTMWKVSTVEGQALYGDDYKSAYYFIQVHVDAAGNALCDEFHGGPGFITNHVYFGNYFEQSLRLVDPRTSLHYMEYTRYFDSDDYWKTHMANANDGGAWLEFLTAKWFGANNPNTGQIIDGRWADIKVPRVSSAFYAAHGIPEDEPFWASFKDGWMGFMDNHAHGYSPYGLQRSVHSISPNEYVLRFNNVDRLGDVRSFIDKAGTQYPYIGITCDNYVSFLEKVKGSSKMLASELTESRTHGLIHSAFGGGGGDPAAANDEILKNKFGFLDSDLASITKWSHGMMKNDGPRLFTRQAPDQWNCSAFPSLEYGIERIAASSQDLAEEFGMIECDAPAHFFEDEDSVNEWFTLFTGAKEFLHTSDNMFARFDINQKRELMKTLANRGQYDGDMHTSAAAADPLFWVQHGGTERLWQWMETRNYFSDEPFVQWEKCTGHSATGKLRWLQGYNLNDETLRPDNVTIAELTDMLSPRSSAFEDNFNFVYEPTNFEWCPGMADLI